MNLPHIIIPSYDRANRQLTLQYLRECSYPVDDVTLIVARDEDYRDYQKWKRDGYCSEIIKHDRPETSCAGSRNVGMQLFPAGDEIVMLDDDIKYISKLVRYDPKTRKGELERLSTAESLIKLFSDGFKVARSHRTILWGIYPVHNAYFMKPNISPANILIGTVMGVINSDIYFDEKMVVKDDYEYSCRIIQKYGAAPRLNMYAAEADHYSKGGCERFWKSDRINTLCAVDLLFKYPDLLKPHPKRKGEVMFRAPRGCGGRCRAK